MSDVLAKVTEIWGLRPTTIVSRNHSPDQSGAAMDKIYTMWRREKLHSVACLGISAEDDSLPQKSRVVVPAINWAEMRMLGDRFGRPSSVYLAVQQDVYFCSWPVHDGLGYPIQFSTKGGVVSIPAEQFDLVHRKPQERQK